MEGRKKVLQCSADGQTSNLSVFPNRVRMIVDDEDIGQLQSSSPTIPDTGGTVLLGKDRFKGCISNLYTRRWDLLTFQCT